MSRLIRPTRARILQQNTLIPTSPTITFIHARALYSTPNVVSRDESDSTFCSTAPPSKATRSVTTRIENAPTTGSRASIPKVTLSHPQPRGGSTLRIHSTACAQVLTTAKDQAPEPLSPIVFSKSRNSRPWTREDDTQLTDMRQQGHTWKEIGLALGRSRQACNRRFDAHLNPRFGPSSTIAHEGSPHVSDSLPLTKTDQLGQFWKEDPEKIEVLKTMVQEGFAWKEIAQKLGDIKASACEKQWRLLRRQASPPLLKPSREKKTRVSSDVDTISSPNPTQGCPASTQFRRADLERLKRAVDDYGVDQWDRISTEIFQSQLCASLLRYQYTQMERRRRVWTIAQEKTLLQLVQTRTGSRAMTDKAGTTSNTAHTTTTGMVMEAIASLSDEQWESISRDVPGEHTGEECRKQWLTLELSPSRKLLRDREEGHETDSCKKSVNVFTKDLMEPSETARKQRATWTREQTQRLESIIEGMRALSDNNYYLYRRSLVINDGNDERKGYGTGDDSCPITSFNNNAIQDGLLDWSLIADQMRDKSTGERLFTKGQCKSRWYRLLREQAPTKKSGPWEKHEVEALVEGLTEKGPQWTEIQRMFVQGRSPTFIQAKWKAVQARIQKRTIIQRQSWDQAAAELFGDKTGAQMELLMKKRPELCLDYRS